MLTLKDAKRNREIYVPTRFSEIDFENVMKVLDNVTIAEHYAIIALCQSFTPFNLAVVGTNKSKDMVVPVSANFIKSNDPNKKLPANCGDKLIISRTDLELSTHLPITFGLSTSTLSETIADNPEIKKQLMEGIVDQKGNPVKEIVAIEFKVVPLTAIKAVIDRTFTVKDCYIAYPGAN